MLMKLFTDKKVETSQSVVRRGQRLRVWTGLVMLVEGILLTSSVADQYLNASSFLQILWVHKRSSPHFHTTNSAFHPLLALSQHSLEEKRRAAKVTYGLVFRVWMLRVCFRVNPGFIYSCFHCKIRSKSWKQHCDRLELDLLLGEGKWTMKNSECRTHPEGRQCNIVLLSMFVP